ncbi:MAG: hypothetical protein ACRD0J_17185 [Acidimicrobiales bacterium]
MGIGVVVVLSSVWAKVTEALGTSGIVPASVALGRQWAIAGCALVFCLGSAFLVGGPPPA